MRGFPIEKPMTEEEIAEAEAVALSYQIGICPECFKKWYYRDPWTCWDCGVELHKVEQ